jgi:hypothetical protein
MDAKVNYGMEELNYLSCVEDLMEQLKDAENSGMEFFTPEFSPLQVHYRAKLVVRVEQQGWVLQHWSVTGIPPFVCAYPIFRRETKKYGR